MRRSAHISLILVAFVAIWGTESPAQDRMQVARKAVESKLSDPLAAQFRNMAERTVINKKSEPMQVVCGEVNAKNVYGGYAGYAQFIYLPALKAAFVLGPDRDVATLAMIRDYCR